MTELKSNSRSPFKLLPNAELGSLMAEVLEKGESFQFRALGWSMAPFIKPGDMLLIEPIGERKSSVGDIVAFSLPEPGGYRVHRVIHRVDKGFLIKGDNLNHADGIIIFEGILGKVKKVSRRGKKVRLGINMGNRGVALFSRLGWLIPIVSRLRKITRFIETKKSS